MEGFARLLAYFVDRPVINRTALSGEFDVVLNLSMQDLVALRASRPATGQSTASQAGQPTAPENGAPGNFGSTSIFAAVSDLGLKLVPERAGTKHLVVDNASEVPPRTEDQTWIEAAIGCQLAEAVTFEFHLPFDRLVLDEMFAGIPIDGRCLSYRKVLKPIVAKWEKPHKHR